MCIEEERDMLRMVAASSFFAGVCPEPLFVCPYCLLIAV